MPTDLPPDYKPEPVKPGEGKTPDLVPRPPKGEDVNEGGGSSRPGALPGRGLPGRGLPGPGGDVVDPPGWAEPEGPGGDPAGVPQPAGTPTF